MLALQSGEGLVAAVKSVNAISTFDSPKISSAYRGSKGRVQLRRTADHLQCELYKCSRKGMGENDAAKGRLKDGF